MQAIFHNAEVIRKFELIGQAFRADLPYDSALQSLQCLGSFIRRNHIGKALKSVMLDNMSDSIELYKQFSDDPNFQKWLANMVFQLTYNQAGKPFVGTNRHAGA